MADDRKEGRSVARRAEEDEEAATSSPGSATSGAILCECRPAGTYYESRETRSAGSSKSTELGAGAYSETLDASVHSARAQVPVSNLSRNAGRHA